MRTLTQKLEIIDSETLLVGIDLGHDINVMQAINVRAKKLGKSSFKHTKKGYESLTEEVKQIMKRHQKKKVLVGMEPTNHYWQLLAKALEKEGIPYRLVNAYTVSKYREGGQLDLAKDDLRDAFFIAELLRTGKYMDTQSLETIYAEMRRLSSLYCQQRTKLTRAKIQLKQMVRQIFPEFEQEFKNLLGLTAQAMLRHHAAPEYIRRLTVTQFVAGVRQSFTGKLLAVKKLNRVYALAQESVGLPEWQALQLSIEQCLAQIGLYQQQQEKVRDTLLCHFQALPIAPWVMSLGMGALNSALVVAEIGDLNQFNTGSSLVKLAGLQPVPNSSGRRTRSKTPISKKGRPRLRTALYFGALHLIRKHPVFRAYYQRLKTRPKNPLVKMQALCTLMAKSLRLIHSIVRQQTCFDPSIWAQATGLKLAA